MTDLNDERRARLRRALVKAGRDERVSSALRASLVAIAGSQTTLSSSAAMARSSSLESAGSPSGVNLSPSAGTGAANATVTAASGTTAGLSRGVGASKVAAVSSAWTWKSVTLIGAAVSVVALGIVKVRSESVSSSPAALSVASAAPTASALAETKAEPVRVERFLGANEPEPARVAPAEAPSTVPSIETSTGTAAERRRSSARRTEHADAMRGAHRGDHAERAPSPTASGVALPLDVASSTTEPSRPSSAARLGDEMKRVEAIRSAANAGKSGEALRLLEEYRSEFPSGMLSEETDVLRIESLTRLGRGAAASELARRFLRERPSSPYAARVQAMLERFSNDEQR